MGGSPLRPARRAVVEQLEAQGVQYVFGNPGTIEQGLIDEIEHSAIAYVLALQEAAAIGIADGYARAGQRLAVAQLHSGVGLGNGIGMLYQAMRGGSPLLVLVGEAGLTFDAFEAQMAADLVGMAKPVSKNVFRVLHPQSTLRVLRRAIQTALTPPCGPVVVVLPADLLDQETDEDVRAVCPPVTRVAPSDAVLTKAVGLLNVPGRKVIVMGDGITASGAQAELARAAEALGADVYGANDSGTNMSSENPSYRGQLGHMYGQDSTRLLADARSVLIVGTYVFPEVYPDLHSPFHPDANIVHIDLDVSSIGKNFPVDLGILGDPKYSLARLLAILGRFCPDQKDDATQTFTLPELTSTSPLEAVIRSIAVQARHRLVFDEALTCSPLVTRYLASQTPGDYLLTRGGSLGVGIPGVVGAKFACPNREVIAFTGDGGAMYTPQALWTAHRYGLAIKVVICNNQRYKLLDNNIEHYWHTQGTPEHQHPSSFGLAPSVNFVNLALSMGIQAQQVEKASDAEDAVTAMLNHDGPYLIDATV
ncbi:thiamine pyrophosphate-binding protein [Mycobacteroides chelonae]|uniref:acetolactate synthase n=1 Tax=Mycobacteroides chelonae TaxID=1774 RepID=A0A1S1M0L4_MYCCH|nr:thiamine pyrophosphate-binding protein [Mycobacteroides chelonae]OHU28270.1 thiamine pyrophosphate-binding protein [Mycobacteroides chelonae]OHU63683.1 thiamine pyrophosphate-binding protein [Mycobacteroides chelonae]OHU76428.1 thiamine pyrophosphate-binding protein [Mycobacteroides chelonae]QQG88315.1 thiamine pyrophosphate-binding protein [Mycobacteroides chelonae]QQG93132.1 thiamine pyrophosphate-binding protein [Mycobacteroides chelonae]